MRGVFILLLILGSFVAKAEMNPSAKSRAKLINVWMEQNLELSSEQIPKIEALNLQCEKFINSIISENKGFSCMQAVRKALKEKEKQLETLLSDEQFEKYEKFKHELKEELKNEQQLTSVH